MIDDTGSAQEAEKQGAGASETVSASETGPEGLLLGPGSEKRHQTAPDAPEGQIDPEVEAGAPGEPAGQPEAVSGAPVAVSESQADEPTPEQIEADARRGRAKGALSRALVEFRPFHSDFQIDRFIVGMNGATAWGAFQQVTREIATRVEALKLEYVAAGRLQIERQEEIDNAAKAEQVYETEVKAASKRFAKVEDNEERSELVRVSTRRLWATKRRAELTRTEVLLKLETQRRTIADRERELGRLLAHFEKLTSEIEADGPLTSEKRAKLESDFWFQKTRQSVMAEIVGNGGVSPETLAIVAALPPEQKALILSLATVDREQLQLMLLDFRQYDVGSVPLGGDEVRALLCSQ